MKRQVEVVKREEGAYKWVASAHTDVSSVDWWNRKDGDDDTWVLDIGTLSHDDHLKCGDVGTGINVTVENGRRWE